MECRNCELRKRQFYCQICIKTHLGDFNSQYTHFSNDLRNITTSTSQALVTLVQPARMNRASIEETRRSIDELIGGLGKLRRDCERKKDKVQTLRESLAHRRRDLSAAKRLLHSGGGPLFASTFVSPSDLSGSSSVPASSTSPRPTVTNATSTTSSFSPQQRHFTPSYNHSDALAVPTSSPFMSPHTHPSPQFAPFSNPAAFPSPALLNLSHTLARARNGLVQELIEVFNIVEVGGRPPVGGKAGTKGEWTIGGLILPVPGDMRRYPPEHINTVLTHTVHFLSLLTFYLGVKLPFEVVWTGGKFGVGQPWIGAIRGGTGESGGWARWYNKQPLHLSSSSAPSTPASPPSAGLNPVLLSRSSSKLLNSRSASAAINLKSSKRIVSSPSTGANSSSPTPTSVNPSRHRSSSHSASPHPRSQSPENASDLDLADSMWTASPQSSSSAANSFTHALSMLIYNVCYLAFTQGIDIGLSQAGEVLSNLWQVCCSSELGRWSHETFPCLPPPTPASFPLDFAQLLQATAAPRSRKPVVPSRQPTMTMTAGDRILEEGEGEEGWDLVDEDEL